MEMLLIREDLWEVVGEDAPTTPDATWKSRDAKARATIGLYVDDKQLKTIKGSTSAKDSWTRLQKQHRSGLFSTIVYTKHIFEVRKKL